MKDIFIKYNMYIIVLSYVLVGGVDYLFLPFFSNYISKISQINMQMFSCILGIAISFVLVCILLVNYASKSKNNLKRLIYCILSCGILTICIVKTSEIMFLPYLSGFIFTILLVSNLVVIIGSFLDFEKNDD